MGLGLRQNGRLEATRDTVFLLKLHGTHGSSGGSLGLRQIHQVLGDVFGAFQLEQATHRPYLSSKGAQPVHIVRTLAVPGDQLCAALAFRIFAPEQILAVIVQRAEIGCVCGNVQILQQGVLLAVEVAVLTIDSSKALQEHIALLI